VPSKSVKPIELESTLETQRRQQLMKAAMECVAEVGAEKTTVWMVAERAGVSTGMVLYYYHNKKELINSAIDWAITEFSERLNAVTEGNYGPERLKESMKIFLSDPSGIIPSNFLIQYRMAALNDAEIRQRSLGGYKEGRDSLAKAVRTAQANGQIRPDIQDYSLADLIYTLANGLAAEIAAHPEIMSLERALEIAQLALDAFCVGEEGSKVKGAVGESASARTAAVDGLTGSTAENVERLLLDDGKLSELTARSLATAFGSLYEIAVRESAKG
jgi:AcrR family transcriptional regulator